MLQTGHRYSWRCSYLMLGFAQACYNLHQTTSFAADFGTTARHSHSFSVKMKSVSFYFFLLDCLTCPDSNNLCSQLCSTKVSGQSDTSLPLTIWNMTSLNKTKLQALSRKSHLTQTLSHDSRICLILYLHIHQVVDQSVSLSRCLSLCVWAALSQSVSQSLWQEDRSVESCSYYS